ncbi:MAG: metallophosphoesterase, partial [Verrucomicrobiales bacterium]|nr:metallophosphoesterase [Verrucomicrobiales bacterium]
MNRRRFCRATVAAGVVSPVAAWPVHAEESGVLKFGVITDVHQDIMHDAEERLGVFAQAMKEAEVDFVVQLGDFCVPKEGNRKFLEIWDSIAVPRYHVLGNHDTDGGYKREETVKWWGMPARYYSFDQGGMHFVVLDGNDRPEGHTSGYPRFIADDQIKWLEEDLKATGLRTVVFVHQSLEREEEGGVQNGAAVRGVLEAAGAGKVVACFSGHHHRDYVREISGIAYPQINSA